VGMAQVPAAGFIGRVTGWFGLPVVNGIRRRIKKTRSRSTRQAQSMILL